MTPTASVLQTMSTWPWVRDPRRRRVTLLILAIIFALLALFPKSYKVTAELLPNDSASSLSSSLGGVGGGAGLFSILFGGGNSIEVDLTIARSQAVFIDLARELQREKVIPAGDLVKAATSLRKKLKIEVARGSILKIDCLDSDPRRGAKIVNAYTQAIRQRLSTLNLNKISERKAIAQQRMDMASTRLSLAQGALIQFKTANRLGAPEAELGATSGLISGLEGQLEAEKTNLGTLSQFGTEQNIGIQASRARIANLEAQIARARTDEKGAGAPTLGTLTPKLTQYQNLYREERYAEAEFQIYERYLDTVRIDELAADINLDLIEPPFVDPKRQFNVMFLGLLALTLILAAFSEFYLAAPRRKT